MHPQDPEVKGLLVMYVLEPVVSMCGYPNAMECLSVRGFQKEADLSAAQVR